MNNNKTGQDLELEEDDCFVVIENVITVDIEI